MASTITSTRTIRMNNEVAEWLSKTDARKVMEGLYDFVRKGDIEWHRGELKIPAIQKGVHTNSREEKLIGANRDLRIEIERLNEEIERLKKESAASVITETMKELESMAQSVGLTRDELLDDFRFKLETGEIGISPEGLTVGTVDECPFDWRSFTNACDEIGRGYDEALSKVVPMLFKV